MLIRLADNEGRADEVEQKKNEQLHKAQKEGKGEYKEELMSDSESAVRHISLVES
jgi:hypothetical protein